jgi:hypothetical protein
MQTFKVMQHNVPCETISNKVEQIFLVEIKYLQIKKIKMII